MNTIKTILLLTIVAVFTSCSDDDGPSHAPVMADKTISVSENISSDLVTQMEASDSENHTLTFSMVSQTPSNSVSINSTNGEIYVANPSSFDYEQNTQIQVLISVSDSITSTEATLTIDIIDEVE